MINKKHILKTALIFLTSWVSYGQAASNTGTIPNVSVDCSGSTCIPNFSVPSNFIRSSYNAIDAGSSGSNISVGVQATKAPRSLRMNVVNGPFPNGTQNPGYDLNVNLSSSTKTASAGNFVLIGDNFKNLTVALDGYSGAAGKNASALCASNIKAGLYGSDALSFFTNFRLNNPTVSQNNCVIDDITFLQTNKFKCDAGFKEITTTNSVYSVNVQRVPKINRCQANLSYDVCLKKKVQVSCTWNIYNGTFSFTGNITATSNSVTGVPSTANLTVGQVVFGTGMPSGTTITAVSGATVTLSNAATVTYPGASLSASAATQFATTISRTMPENQFNYYRNIMSDADICNNHVAQEVSDTSYSTPSGVTNPRYSNPNTYSGCASGNCYWKEAALVSNLTTPGMNNDALAQGSVWELMSTTPGVSCDSSLNPATGFWATYKTVNVNYVAYDPTNAQCNAADIVTYSGGSINSTYPAISLDPNKNATWFYTGQAQESDFGSEVVECDLGNCPVDSVTSDLTQTLDTITPGDGENGTQQGTGLLLIYDAQTVTTESKVGVAGAGGNNDIISQSGTRVCAKVRDVTSDGLASDFAKAPMVNFNRYTWGAIKTTASGNPGQQPVNPGSAVVVWKKLDSSVRDFLKNELFNQ
jgi:hypothetical protein